VDFLTKVTKLHLRATTGCRYHLPYTVGPTSTCHPTQ